MSTHPEVLWAQRSNVSVSEKNLIYLTINLSDINESTLKYELNDTSLSFSARTKTGGETNYAFNLEFFAAVDPENSTKRLTSRALVAVLRKKEAKLEYWPRLTKDKQKTPFIKTDFNKWVDEDEQDGNPSLEDNDFDPSSLGGLPGGPGGLPGMGGDFDFSKLSGDFGPGASVGASTGAEHAEVENDADESDDDGPPPLEEPESSK